MFGLTNLHSLTSSAWAKIIKMFLSLNNVDTHTLPAHYLAYSGCWQGVRSDVVRVEAEQLAFWCGWVWQMCGGLALLRGLPHLVCKCQLLPMSGYRTLNRFKTTISRIYGLK